MSKKIFMLLFLMLVLISMSAVSAADVDDNNGTIVSSADAEVLAVENDVGAIDVLSEDVADGDDVALANDAKSVAAGNNESYGATYEEAEGDSVSPVIGDENYRIDIMFDSTYDPIRTNFMCMIIGFDPFDEVEGTLDLYVDNDLKGSFPIANGTYKGEIDSLDAGDYEWYAEFNPVEYNSSTGEGNFTINKKPTSIDIDPTEFSIEMTVFERVILAASLTGGPGELTYSSSDENVAYLIRYSDFEEPYIIANGTGTAIITVSFAGDKNYAASSQTIPVNVTANFKTIYVNATAAPGGDGKSEETAFRTLQDALNISRGGDTIMIAAGTYTGENNTGLYINNVLFFEKYGDGEAILDAENQRKIWSVYANTISINGLTFKNGKASEENGGAIFFWRPLSNSNINASFINNSAGALGGAIHFEYKLTNVNITGSFIDNTVTYDGGGAIYLSHEGNLVIISGEFRNNHAECGGAIYCYEAISNSIINATFINNSAKESGGAIFFENDMTNVNITGNFTNNAVTEEEGSAIFLCEMTSVDVTGKFINNTGKSVIYIRWGSNGNNVIHDSIFINNNASKIINTDEYGEVKAEDNWFGNNASNYNIKPEVGENVTMTNWLFLNAITNTTGEITINETSEITFKLYTYNSTSEEINEYDASKMNIKLDLSQIHGTLNQTAALINEPILYKYAEEGVASVTGKFETVSYTIILARQPTKIIINKTGITLKVDESVPAGATLNPPEAGNLTYTSSNESVVRVEDGVIIAVGEGNAIVTVSFNGSEDYAAAENKNISVTVSLYDVSVSVNNSTLDLFVGDNFTIVATTLPEGLNVAFVPDDSGVYSVDENGFVTALKNGTGSILVKVGGYGVFVENSTVVNVTVNKLPTEIIIANDTIDLKAFNFTSAGATLNPAEAGNLTYTSSNSSVAMVYGGVIIPVSQGQAIITVSFNGTDKYAAAENKTITVNVGLNDASVSVDNSTLDLNIGDTYAINATTVPAILKIFNITYTSSNESVVIVDGNGTVTAIGEGNAIITLSVGDDRVFAKNSTEVFVTVSKVPTEISVSADALDLKILENLTVGATLIPDVGNLTYTSSNPSVAIVENGMIKALAVGNATITVSFAGDDVYAAAENKTINVTVSLKDVIINVNNSTVELVFGESFTINATTVPEGLNLTYVVDDSGVVSVDENGVVTLLKLGIAKVLVKFEGNDIYAENSTVVTVKVKIVKIAIPPEEAFNFTCDENGTQVISVDLPEDATGFVLMDINGTQTHVPLVNGKANLTVPRLAEGTYNVTVSYTGDDWYAPITTTKEINVTSNVPETALSIPESSESDVPTTYSISLPSDAGGYLEVDVDGKQYSAPLNNGSATISVLVDSGSHNVTVKYSGDENYSPVTKEVTLNVTNPIVNIAENKDVATVYSANATYKVLVTRDGQAVVGDAVVFKYNGASYTVKIDSQGYATLKLKTKLKVNKYTVTATYKGVKVTNTVTIKSILVAQNKKVKKSSKVTKINISLKKVNGNYLKCVAVKIIFNGKAYKVKTNNKGVAVWKVKKSMLTKHKVGKKYNYKVVYGKDSVTKKLTIKK